MLSIPAFTGGKSVAQYRTVSSQVFYDQLSPYGEWVNYPSYGYVWIPNNNANFSPYATNGYWVYTDYGWTWVSDYPWGWAPFHYGRWDFDDSYGWYWVPDYQWAPAWVAWSSSPGYYGWAPLRPGIDVDEVISNGYRTRPDRWCYVHEEYMGRRDMERHYDPRGNNADHIRNSTMISRTYIDNARHTKYIGGPPREDVQKSTGAPVQQLTIAPRSKPGQTVNAQQVSLYQPTITRAPASAPLKVTELKDFNPLTGRTANPQQTNAATPVQTGSNRNPGSNTPPPVIQSERNTGVQAAPQNRRNGNSQQRSQRTTQQNATRNSPSVQQPAAPSVHSNPQPPHQVARPQSLPPAAPPAHVEPAHQPLPQSAQPPHEAPQPKPENIPHETTPRTENPPHEAPPAKANPPQQPPSRENTPHK